jgi:hypothetical protein
MKYYLLIAGEDYYPSRRTGDWIGCFETYEEALSQVKVEKYNFQGNACDESYTVNGSDRDWYEIVDLRGWING